MTDSNFIGLADGNNITVKNFANNVDIQKYVQAAAIVSADIVKRSKFPQAFKGRNVEETARNIWEFLKARIEYTIDPKDWQLLRLAPRFVKDGKGDCKSYSIFTASVLSALGLPVVFEFTNYINSRGELPDPKYTPTHVYITTRDENGKRIIIDGVYTDFNKEKKYFYKKEVPMKIAVLSGTDSTITATQANQYNGNKSLESDYKKRYIVTQVQAMLNSNNPAIQQQGELYLARIKSSCCNETAINGKAWTGFKKVTLSGARNAFLALVKLNFRGLATRLNHLDTKVQGGKGKLDAKWKQLGGSPKALRKAIAIGRTKKPLLGAKAVKGIAEPVSLAVILTSAAGVAVAIAPLLKNIGAGKETSNADLLADITAAGGDFTLPAKDSLTDEQVEKSGGEKNLFGIDNKLLIFGAVGLGLVLLGNK